MRVLLGQCGRFSQRLKKDTKTMEQLRHILDKMNNA
jgi:hypothetical protein